MYLGIQNKMDFSKYKKVDQKHFHMLIDESSTKSIFGELHEDFEYLSYRGHLVIKKDGLHHLFVYEHDTSFPNIEKVKEGEYRYWIGSIRRGEEIVNYHVYLYPKQDKIIFADAHLQSIFRGDTDFDLVAVRTLQIQQEMVEEIDPLNFEDFVKSNNGIEKYNL
jgi:hypothetical protein